MFYLWSRLLANFLIYTEGLFLGFSLIIAIGAQNLFVFHQGLIGRHVFLVCLFCSLSDALLIFLGYSGMFIILNENEYLRTILLFAGSLWVSIYGIMKIREGIRPKSPSSLNMMDKTSMERGLSKTLITVAGITWLNPHVYLDTVFLIGSIANTIEVKRQIFFVIGAMSASFLFFFLLGYIGNKIGKKLKSPSIWKKVNIFLGIVMLLIGTHLGFSGLNT